MIKTYNLRKNYASLTAVKDVNITLSKGEILGLVGPNGAGKTTLLKMLSTLIEPTTGSALIMGHDIFKEKLQIRRHIGYLPDFFNFFDDLKLRELLYFFAHTYGVPEEEREERINIALEETDLFMKQNDFIKNLSRGMTQRLGLAALLVHEPAIFLLDEPASGLDPQARITLRTILKKLAAKGKTIIISSHILTELDGFCSHIAIMNKGELLLHEKVDIVQSQIKGRRSLKVTVLNKVEEALKIIKNFSGVSKVSNTNKTFSAEYLGDDELIANINTELVKNGVKVVNIIREKKNFEDLFMQLTKELDLSV
jgi:ABC-2 type transport system ATP-binding protein